MGLLRRRTAATGGGGLTIVSAVDAGSPNGWYRAVGPLEQLRERGHKVITVGQGGEALRVLGDADVLHVHRFWDDAAHRLVAAARELGAAVVWDDDDDFTAVPRGTVSHKRLGGLRGARRTAAVRRMLASADIVTTPNEHLAGRLRALGAARVEVIPNFVPPEFARASPLPHDGLVVGWIAGLEHQYDLDQLGLRAVFARLLDEHPQLRFTSVGVGLGLPRERYEHERLVSLAALPRWIGGFDVGIAPLADVPFNHARSDIKLKEYGAVGIPWIASAVGPYRGMGEEQGGLVVGADDWHAALTRLIEDAKERKRLAKRAQRWGREQTVAANAHRWETVLREAVAVTGRAGAA